MGDAVLVEEILVAVHSVVEAVAAGRALVTCRQDSHQSLVEHRFRPRHGTWIMLVDVLKGQNQWEIVEEMQHTEWNKYRCASESFGNRYWEHTLVRALVTPEDRTVQDLEEHVS
eukprot:2753857-Rhodomonas_salina.1